MSCLFRRSSSVCATTMTSSSLGQSSQSATALSADFYNAFQAAKSHITAAIDAGALPAAEEGLQNLRRELNAATPYLPPYDLRTCDVQLREIEQVVASLRARDRPKSKFSFAKRTASAQASSSMMDVEQPVASTSYEPVSEAAPAHEIAHQTGVYLRPTFAPGQTYSLTLSNLSHCIINLLPAPGDPPSGLTALHAQNLLRCIVIAPVVAGSVMMTGLQGCLVIAGCQQFRIHASKESTLLLEVPSHPVIEHSTSLRFGGYPSSILSTPSAIPSKHTEVLDFGWLQQTPSPNWTVCDPKDVADYDVDYAAKDWNAFGLNGDMLQAVLNRYLGDPGDA